MPAIQKSSERRTARHVQDEFVVFAGGDSGARILYEIGRLKTPTTKLISRLSEQIGLRVCELPFKTVSIRLCEKWGRTLSTAYRRPRQSQQRALLTRDERLHKHYSRAVW